MTQHELLMKRKAQAALWKRGELSFLFDETQMQMKRAFEASEERKFIFLCSRRLGKSYLLCGLALEYAIRRPNTKIIYITATAKNAKNIVQPLMGSLMETCPNSARPQFKTQDSKYVFPNGSQIFLVGVDRDPDACRGQEAQLVLVDEAGFVDKLDYLVSSVLTPMLMMTNGRILMGTTPPKSTDHPFIPLLEEAVSSGAVITKTIYDCPRVTPKMVAEYMAEAGGEASGEWRREYLCQVIQDEEKTVFPEWTPERETACVREVDPAPYRDRYVGMDLGWVDNTALVFGWWDFENARLVIEDELIIEQENTAIIAQRVRAKEASIWGPAPPYKRVADVNNPQLLHDLSSLHQLPFGPAIKDYSKESGINKVRLMIANNQLIIHPRCTRLQLQLKYCKWKGGERVTFERSAAHGHYDLCDALILVCNTIHYNRNPIPEHHNPHAQYRPLSHQKSHPLQALVPPRFQRPTRKIKRFR